MKIIVHNEIPLTKNQYFKQYNYVDRQKYEETLHWTIWKCEYDHNHYSKLDKARITFDIYFRTNRTNRKVGNYAEGGIRVWLRILSGKGFMRSDDYSCIGSPIVNLHVDKNNPRTEINIEERNNGN